MALTDTFHSWTKKPGYWTTRILQYSIPTRVPYYSQPGSSVPTTIFAHFCGDCEDYLWLLLVQFDDPHGVGLQSSTWTLLWYLKRE
jgi:hypothetical protein